MLPAECVAPTDQDSSVALDHGVKAIQTAPASLDFKQAMASLHFVPENTLGCNDSSQEVTIQCAQEQTVRIKDDFAFIIQDHITAERAAMARPKEAEPWVIKDNSTIVMDCGASSSLTGSLLNTNEISEKMTRIETADGAETMKATHHCMKTYFVRNRMGETKSITVPALYVRGLPQDLLGGKSLTR